MTPLIANKKKGMNVMTSEKMYYEAEAAVLSEIAKEKSLFSFRTFIRLITANSISRKF